MDHHKFNSNNNFNNNNNNWRNKNADNYRHYNRIGAGYRPRSSHSNSRSNFGWQLSSWEKKFCSTAGVPWQKVLETKKYMHQDKKVIQWQDSAVKEAFWNAKKRFWAEIHGQPCNIKLPDPDIFIDKIDWDTNIDPDLIIDLENRELDTSCETDGGVVVGIPVIPEQYLHTLNGWGDVEEDHQESKEFEPLDDSNVYDGWDSNVYDNEKQWNKSRYKISRFHHNNNVNGKVLVENYENKKVNFGYERPWMEWRPVAKGW